MVRKQILFSPQCPSRWSFKWRILLLDERETIILKILCANRQVFIISWEDPLNDFVIVTVSELDLKPLGPPLEPTVAAFHVHVAVGQVEFPGLGLNLTRLWSISTCLPSVRIHQQNDFTGRDVLFEFHPKFWKVDRLLTGLTPQQKGTTAQWYSNKTSLSLQ